MKIIEAPAELHHHLSKGQILCGLDFGSKTIGMALSDTRLKIGSPFKTIARRKFTQDANEITAVITERDVGGIVMGLPLNMDGSEGPRAQSSRAFIRNLEKTHLPELDAIAVTFWDERLSTQAVTRTLIEADASRARRAELVDKMAASFILQGYLDFIAQLEERDVHGR